MKLQDLLYPKIDGLYRRESERPHRLLVGEYRNEAVEYLADHLWEFTEKVDGTNIRVIWDGHRIEWRGRTNSAQIPKMLEAYLQETFGTDAMEQLFEQIFGEKEVVIYGEGYGAKIQKGGGNYLPDSNSFIVFDILISGLWLNRGDMKGVAEALGLDVVPLVAVQTVKNMAALIEHCDQPSIVAEGRCQMEGVVGKPLVPLRDRQGKRIIVKIRKADFKED